MTHLQTLAPQPRDLGGGFMVRRLLPVGRPARRRPVRLLRPLRADRRRARRPPRRAAASAHRPGDADLPVRGRDHASRLDRRRPADRARRRQLDDGRARHRPFGAHAQGPGRPARTAATACSSGSPCRRRTRTSAPSFQHVPAERDSARPRWPARPRTSLAGTAFGATSPVADRVADAGGRLRSRRGAGARPSRWPAATRASARSTRVDHPIEVDGVKVRRVHDGRPRARDDAGAGGAARRPRRPRRRRAARPPLHVLELRLQHARAHPRRRGRLARSALRRGSRARPSSSRFPSGRPAPRRRPDRAGISMSALPATASAAPAAVSSVGRKPSKSDRDEQREQRRHHADRARRADADAILQGQEAGEGEHRAGEARGRRATATSSAPSASATLPAEGERRRSRRRARRRACRSPSPAAAARRAGGCGSRPGCRRPTAAPTRP